MLNPRRLFFAILISLAAALTSFHSAAQQANAQQVRTAQSDPIPALLDLPSRLPESVYVYADPWEHDNKTAIPDDQAPLELLYNYWTRPSQAFPDRARAQSNLNDKIRQRLLEAAEEDNERLFRILLFDLAPDTSEAHDRIKAILDKRPPLPVNWNQPDQRELSPDQQQEFSWQQTVRNWLMQHSRYFRDELVQRASQIYEAEGMIHNEGVLVSLARIDWERAQTVLEMHATSNSPRRAALSLAIQYKRAVEMADADSAESLRERLLKITRDKQSPAYARHKAAEMLINTAWPGRDDFYLSLFRDGLFINLKEGPYSFNTLATLLKEDVDKWLPVIARMVESPNRSVHDSAVSALIQLDLWKPRREALLLLLPWLSDPGWSSAGTTYTREQLIQSFGRTQVPEAVPHLIAILEGNETGLREWAARTLANYYAPQAGPILKKLGSKSTGMTQGAFAAALIGCGALSDEEKFVSLELYASKVSRVNADNGLDYSLVGGDFDSFNWRIGADLTDEKQAPLHLAAALLDRAKELQKENAQLAKNLLFVVQRWPVAAVFSNIVERIGDGTADRLAIGQALRHREKLRASVNGELQSLIGKGGRAAGIASALLGDEAVQKEVLEGRDSAAQAALLACARLIRDPLPVALVGSLYQTKDQILRKAVDLYLASLDTAEARNLLLAQHSNEALITGSRSLFAPQEKDAISKWEETLRSEVLRSDGSEEIFSMAVAGYDRVSQNLVVRVSRDKAVAIKAKDESRDEYLNLSKSELQQIRETFASMDFDNLNSRILIPPAYVDAGFQTTEFVHLKSVGGRAIFTNTVFEQSREKTDYQRLHNLFSTLAKSPGFKLRYKLENHVKGVEVLYADEKNSVQNICMQDRQLRVLIQEETTDQQEIMRRRESFQPPYDWNWRTFQNGKLAEMTTEPSICPIIQNNEEYEKDVIGNRDETFQRPWQLRSRNETIRVGYLRSSNARTRGVWRLKPGKEPEQISEMYCGWPLVTKDGKWLIVTQYGESSKKTLNTIVRFDLRTNQSFQTDLSSRDYIQPVAELSGKILIVRPEGSYLRATTGDYYLLDPATGITEPVKGEFRPLQQQTYRPLQSVLGSSEYWAAIPDEKQNKTQVGRYDAKRFVFIPLVDLPVIKFDSMQMWVDETAQQIYIAYNGHLLKIPFPQRRQP